MYSFELSFICNLHYQSSQLLNLLLSYYCLIIVSSLNLLFVIIIIIIVLMIELRFPVSPKLDNSIIIYTITITYNYIIDKLLNCQFEAKAFTDQSFHYNFW